MGTVLAFPGHRARPSGNAPAVIGNLALAPDPKSERTTPKPRTTARTTEVIVFRPKSRTSAPDQSGSGQINTYANGDPVNRSDPSGQYTITEATEGYGRATNSMANSGQNSGNIVKSFEMISANWEQDVTYFTSWRLQLRVKFRLELANKRYRKLIRIDQNIKGRSENAGGQSQIWSSWHNDPPDLSDAEADKWDGNSWLHERHQRYTPETQYLPEWTQDGRVATFGDAPGFRGLNDHNFPAYRGSEHLLAYPIPSAEDTYFLFETRILIGDRVLKKLTWGQYIRFYTPNNGYKFILPAH